MDTDNFAEGSTSPPGGNQVDGLPTAGVQLKDNLKNFDLNLSSCEKLASSFCSLTIFSSSLREMMSACKARAPDEGGMMNSL